MQKIAIVKNGNCSQKRIAITFDDGPNPYFTPQILRILKDNSIKASFFLIGKWAEQNTEIVQMLLADGHSIGAHSQEHAFYKNGLELCLDMIEGIKTLEKVCCSKIKFIRFPRFRYRPIEEIELPHSNNEINILFEKISSGYIQVIDCSINTHDWNLSIPNEQIITDLFNNLSNSSIIVLHDGSEKESELAHRPARTIEILNIIIPKLKSLGYQFVNLDGLEMSKTYKIFYDE